MLDNVDYVTLMGSGSVPIGQLHSRVGLTDREVGLCEHVVMIVAQEAHYVAALLELAEIADSDRLRTIHARSGIDVTDVVDCVGITSLADADPIVAPAWRAAPANADRRSRPDDALGNANRRPRTSRNDREAVPCESATVGAD